MALFPLYLHVLLITLVLPVGFGLCISLCKAAFCSLVGYRQGRPVLLGLHVIITPLRELAHLIACLLTMHRVTEFQLLNLRDPNAEIGFVEHSYNRKNPLALFGNFLFALMPFLLGLSLSLLIVNACFHGAFQGLLAEVGQLGERGAGLGEYVGLTFAFIPRLFRDAGTGVIAKILGCIFLLLVCLGVYISPEELRGSISGILVYAATAFFVALLIFIACDERTNRIVLLGLRAFSSAFTALCLIVLVFSLAAVFIGFVFFLFRSFGGGHGDTHAVVPYEADGD